MFITAPKCFLAFGLCLSVVFAFSACSSDSGGTGGTDDAAASGGSGGSGGTGARDGGGTGGTGGTGGIGAKDGGTGGTGGTGAKDGGTGGTGGTGVKDGGTGGTGAKDGGTGGTGGSAGSGGTGGGGTGGSGGSAGGGGSGSFSFFYAADSRSGNAEFQKNLESMVAYDPNAIAIINGGDLTPHATDAEWVKHFDQPLAAGGKGKVRADLTDFTPGFIRYLAVLGDHDALYIDSEGNPVNSPDWHANWLKHLPGQKNLGISTPQAVYWSFTYGNALFVAFDHLHMKKDPAASTAQLTWFNNLMKNVGSHIKWKFALFHDAFYGCGKYGAGEFHSPFMKIIEDAGTRFDMVFVADAHTYERTCPMLAGQCATDGVVHINSSGSGAEVRTVNTTLVDTAGQAPYRYKYDCSKILQKAVGLWYHYTHIRITDNKLELKAISHNSTTDVRDTLTIVK